MSGQDAERKRQRMIAEGERMARALRGLARTPDAVIDVGVRRGTPWLYEVYAGVPFVLVDPQEGGEALLEARPSRYVFVNKAAGRACQTRMLNEQGAMSTFLTRAPLTHVPTRKRHEAEIVPLDDIIDAHAPDARRIGLKLDTEGFEIEVLAGLERHVDRIDFIISEASVLNRFENQHNFSELVGAMWQKDFRFYNILNEAGLKAPRVYDCLFLRKDDAAFR